MGGGSMRKTEPSPLCFQVVTVTDKRANPVLYVNMVILMMFIVVRLDKRRRWWVAYERVGAYDKCQM